MGIEGTVLVSFTILKDGELQDVKVSQGIGGGCDEESVRVIKASAAGWLCKRERGVAVPDMHVVRLVFKLRD